MRVTRLGQQGVPLRVVGLLRVRQGRFDNDDPGPEGGRIPALQDSFFEPLSIDLELMHLTVAQLFGDATQGDSGHLEFGFECRQPRLNVGSSNIWHSCAEPGIGKYR